MGRLLYELGEMAEKQRISNERASEKLGKSSFSWAWGLDSLGEERERFVFLPSETWYQRSYSPTVEV